MPLVAASVSLSVTVPVIWSVGLALVERRADAGLRTRLGGKVAGEVDLAVDGLGSLPKHVDRGRVRGVSLEAPIGGLASKGWNVLPGRENAGS